MSSFYDLPTRQFKEQIVASVTNNQVTIITAETGAGKSTQVPQYLAAAGYDKVIVTEPRILAARNLSRRVRQEWSERTGQPSEAVIGYRTASERDDSPDSQILYCTDGLQLVREITGSGVSQKQVLILDEVHEWNENMEVLIAWAKRRAEQEADFKIVIMSATIEASMLGDYFGSQAVIEIPGRHYEVTKRQESDLLTEVVQQIGQGSNVLVFLPGKSEIQQIADAAEKKAVAHDVPIIPLHAQLEATAQQTAFETYQNGKIILATNIAQTSITIDDIDVVIDSGLERQVEVRDGVEGLFINQTSQADCRQRAGRAGRTKPGEYILAQYDQLPCDPIEARPDYGVPEILRKHIDRVTLRLANIGIDIEQLDFYHQPSRTAMKRARQTLRMLGAFESDGSLSAIGRQMEQLPLASSYGRMLVEAYRYDTAVQAKLIVIIAILEVGGIVRGGRDYSGWQKLTRQNKSDPVAQYEVLCRLDETMTSEELEELGIIEKNIAKARLIVDRLSNELGVTQATDEPLNQTQQDQLSRSIVAGQLHQLWTLSGQGEAELVTSAKKRPQPREISSSSVVSHPQLFVATPFDLQVPSSNGGLDTLRLVQDITLVKPIWLEELAPTQFRVKKGDIYYDHHFGSLATRNYVVVAKRAYPADGEAVLDDSKANRRLFTEKYSDWLEQRLRQRIEYKNRHQKRRVRLPGRDKILREVRSLTRDKIVSLDQLDKRDRRKLLRLARLDHWRSQTPPRQYRRHHSHRVRRPR